MRNRVSLETRVLREHGACVYVPMNRYPHNKETKRTLEVLPMASGLYRPVKDDESKWKDSDFEYELDKDL